MTKSAQTGADQVVEATKCRQTQRQASAIGCGRFERRLCNLSAVGEISKWEFRPEADLGTLRGGRRLGAAVIGDREFHVHLEIDMRLNVGRKFAGLEYQLCSRTKGSVDGSTVTAELTAKH